MGVVATTAAPTCDPWVDLVPVLAIYAPELLDPITHEPIDDPLVTVWETAICEASWALFSLTAGKVHPEQCWIEDYSTKGSCRLTLRRQPVAAVDGIEILRQCGREVAELSLTDWCLTSAQTIDLCCGGASSIGYPVDDIYLRYRCGCQDEVVRVHYKVGSTLPPGTEGKVGWLADQYVKAATGQKCSLPERVTAVTRQGVSWTMLDPMEFLEKRFTGIGRLDSWLALVRMSHPAAEYIDPLRSNRLFSQKVTCGGGSFSIAEFGDAQPGNDVFPFDVTDQYLQP